MNPQILIQADRQVLKDTYKEAQKELFESSIMAYFAGTRVGATAAAEILGCTKKTLNNRMKAGLVSSLPRESRNLKFDLRHLLERRMQAASGKLINL
jgi:hypothetical protein